MGPADGARRAISMEADSPPVPAPATCPRPPLRAGACRGRRRPQVQKRLVGEREQRLCVVCQEAEKTTLLMPCRHLCLCGGCSARPEVALCPLCRAPIADRIAVYA